MARGLPAVLLAGALLSCASPTLPLPPPEDPTQDMVDSTHVALSSDCGSVQGNAWVSVVNVTEPAPGGSQIGLWEQASGCGAWAATIFAVQGDAVEIFQQVGTEQGLPLTVIVGKQQ